MRHECKITVIDKKCFTNYQEQYLADPKSGPCPFFNVGDTFLLKRTPQQDDFYPLMLVNRAICGFLGSNSAILRSSAVQRYIPEKLRSRVNALSSVLLTTGASVFSLLMGFSTIAGASRSAALPPCWPVIFSSEAGGRTFERCTRRAEPITSALCAAFAFSS